MNMRQSLKNLVVLASGAGIGALTLYFLDPDNGPRRRQQAANRTNQAYQNIQHSLAPWLQSFRQQTGELGRTAASEVTSFSRNAATQAGSLARRLGVGDMAKQIARRTSDLGQMSGRQLRYLWKPGRLPARDRLPATAGRTMAAVGCAAIGAGAMYLLDPAAGRSRRAMIRDKFRFAANQFRSKVISSGLDLWNFTAAAITEMKLKHAATTPQDRALRDRVHAEIGRAVANVHAIEINADSGRITLSGPVLEQEVDGLFKCVWSVPGVIELVNRLQVYPERGDVPQFQGVEAAFRSGGTPLAAGLVAPESEVPLESRISRHHID